MSTIAGIRTGGTRRNSGLTLVEAAVVVAIVGVLFLVAAWPALSRKGTAPAFETVRVSANQSLWSIAEEYRPEGLGTAETAAVIKRLNGLRSSSLREGSTLQVPASPGPERTAWADR